MWFRKKKKKEFDPETDEFLDLAPGRGGCLGSKRAIRDGFGISYIFRSEPSALFKDSGWWFCHGTEDEAFMSDGSNFEIYDVNTIANIRPEIIPHLDEPIGAAFYWDGDKFVPDPLGAPEELPEPSTIRH
jgi:hypothetical protein